MPDALTQSLTERSGVAGAFVRLSCERGLSIELRRRVHRGTLALKPAPTPIGCLIVKERWLRG